MIRLRPAQPDDLPYFTSFETAPDAMPYVNTYSPHGHARMHARDDVTYLAIDRDGGLDGFVLLVLDPDGESIELRRIVVSEKGRGTGQIAFAAAEAYCRTTLGRRRIWLDVANYNLVAKHIYKKFGFTPFEGPPGAEPETEFLEKRFA